MANVRKLQREALERAMKEALVYGCTVHVDQVKPFDAQGHQRLIITEPRSGLTSIQTLGTSPKNAKAMVDGVGNRVRMKCRELVGSGADRTTIRGTPKRK